MCHIFKHVTLSSNTSCLLHLQHSGIRASLRPWGRLRAQAAAMQLWQARGLTSSQLSPHRRPAPSSSPAPLLRPCWRVKSCESGLQTLRGLPACSVFRSQQWRAERRTMIWADHRVICVTHLKWYIQNRTATNYCVKAIGSDSGFVTIPIYSRHMKSVSHI